MLRTAGLIVLLFEPHQKHRLRSLLKPLVPERRQFMFPDRLIPHYKISNAGGDLSPVLLKTPLPDHFASLSNSEMLLLQRKRMRVSAAALSILPYAESLGVTIKHEPLTRDQSNLQKTPISFQFLSRNPVNEGVTFQEALPKGRKILALPHEVSA